MEDLALVVVSCDSYTELGKIFFDLQKKYMGWFHGPTYFINESKPAAFEGVRTIHVGTDVDWSGKILRALEQIPQAYILFMLEDYFIGKEVRQQDVQQAVAIMKQHELCYYRITAIPDTKKESDIAPFLAAIPSNLYYGVNLQPAIFSRDYLKQVVSGPDRSAWAVETDLLKEVTATYEYDIPGCVLDRRNIIDVHNGVIKGKWVRKTIRYFKKNGYRIDLGERKMLSVAQTTKIELMNMVVRLLPTEKLRKIKSFLRKLGIRFVTDD